MCVGRLLDEREYHPLPLAEGESDAGFSQMPLDTQLPGQAGTQANLLPRFGAVSVPAPGELTLACRSCFCL